MVMMVDVIVDLGRVIARAAWPEAWIGLVGSIVADISGRHGCCEQDERQKQDRI